MKLLRADEHLGQFRAEFDSFLNERNPYRMVREADAERDYYVWRVKIEEHPPLEKWSALIGECVHALRSALDHTAYELVRINQPLAEYSEFPIFKNRGKWKKDHAAKLPGVGPEVLTQVKWLQPYRRGGVMEPLWLIHELDIIDKHRRMNLVSSAITATRWDVVGGKVVDIQPDYGPFEDGAPVVRFKMAPDSRDAHMHVNTVFAFDIAFGQGERLAGHSVSLTLEAFIVETAGLVSLFDRFLL